MAYRLRSERSGNSSVWVRIPPSAPYGSVAQWIVQQISTLQVVGSNPTAFTKGEGVEPVQCRYPVDICGHQFKNW